jgi:bacterioferritin
MTNNRPFLSDIEELRRRARQDMNRGAITASYALDLTQAVDILNKVLASELVCVLRYKRHFYMSQGLHAEPIAQEFLQHANDEQLHADQVAVRITQLGGAPNFDPAGMLERAASPSTARATRSLR